MWNSMEIEQISCWIIMSHKALHFLPDHCWNSKLFRADFQIFQQGDLIRCYNNTSVSKPIHPKMYLFKYQMCHLYRLRRWLWKVGNLFLMDSSSSGHLEFMSVSINSTGNPISQQEKVSKHPKKLFRQLLQDNPYATYLLNYWIFIKI